MHTRLLEDSKENNSTETSIISPTVPTPSHEEFEEWAINGYNETIETLVRNNESKSLKDLVSSTDPSDTSIIKKLIIFNAFEYKKMDVIKTLVMDKTLTLEDFDNISLGKKRSLAEDEIIKYFQSLQTEHGGMAVIYTLLSEQLVERGIIKPFFRKILEKTRNHHTTDNREIISFFYLTSLIKHISTISTKESSIVPLLKQILKPGSSTESVSLLRYYFYMTVNERSRYVDKPPQYAVDKNESNHLIGQFDSARQYIAMRYATFDLVAYLSNSHNAWSPNWSWAFIHSLTTCFIELACRLYPYSNIVEKTKKTYTDIYGDDERCYRGKYESEHKNLAISIFQFIQWAHLNEEFNHPRLAAAILRLKQIDLPKYSSALRKQDQAISERFQLAWKERGYAKSSDPISLIVDLYAPTVLLKPLIAFIEASLVSPHYKNLAKNLLAELTVDIASADVLIEEKQHFLEKINITLSMTKKDCKNAEYNQVVKTIKINIMQHFKTPSLLLTSNNTTPDDPKIESKTSAGALESNSYFAIPNYAPTPYPSIQTTLSHNTESKSTEIDSKEVDTVFEHMTAIKPLAKISLYLDHSSPSQLSHKKRLVINTIFTYDRIDLLIDLIIQKQITINDVIDSQSSSHEIQKLFKKLIETKNGMQTIYDFLKNEKLAPVIKSEADPFKALAHERRETKKRHICTYLRAQDTFAKKLLEYIKSLPPEQNNTVKKALHGVFNATIHLHKNIHNLMAYILFAPVYEEGIMPRPQLNYQRLDKIADHFNNGIVGEYFNHLAGLELSPHFNLSWLMKNDKDKYERMMKYLYIVFLNSDLPHSYHEIEWAFIATKVPNDLPQEEITIQKHKAQFVLSTWINNEDSCARCVTMFYEPEHLLEKMDRHAKARFTQNKEEITELSRQLKYSLSKAEVLKKHNKTELADKAITEALNKIAEKDSTLPSNSAYSIILNQTLKLIKSHYNVEKVSEYKSTTKRSFES